MALGITGITTSAVGNALGTSSRDIGTLCTHPNINKWAKYKPVRSTTAAPDRDVDWWRGDNKDNGLYIPETTVMWDSFQAGAWNYLPPIGGVSSPYRLADFGGYVSNGIPFVHSNFITSSITYNKYYERIFRMEYIVEPFMAGVLHYTDFSTSNFLNISESFLYVEIYIRYPNGSFSGVLDSMRSSHFVVEGYNSISIDLDKYDVRDDLWMLMGLRNEAKGITIPLPADNTYPNFINVRIINDANQYDFAYSFLTIQNVSTGTEELSFDSSGNMTGILLASSGSGAYSGSNIQFRFKIDNTKGNTTKSIPASLTILFYTRNTNSIINFYSGDTSIPAGQIGYAYFQGYLFKSLGVGVSPRTEEIRVLDGDALLGRAYLTYKRI